jgi:hypothetical protein
VHASAADSERPATRRAERAETRAPHREAGAPAEPRSAPGSARRASPRRGADHVEPDQAQTPPIAGGKQAPGRARVESPGPANVHAAPGRATVDATGPATVQAPSPVAGEARREPVHADAPDRSRVTRIDSAGEAVRLPRAAPVGYAPERQASRHRPDAIEAPPAAPPVPPAPPGARTAPADHPPSATPPGPVPAREAASSGEPTAASVRRLARAASKLPTAPRRRPAGRSQASEATAQTRRRSSTPLEVTVEIASIEIVEHAPARAASARAIPVSLGDYLRSRSGR